MKKDKAFTLIELIAVLVILAILALIVTPLVLSIIRKAKIAADKRSVDNYGKSVELAIASYILDNSKLPNCETDLTIEYSGNQINCDVMYINENGSIYLSQCRIGRREVLDSTTSDGYYHYGHLQTRIEEEPSQVYNSYQIGDVVTYNDIEFYVIKNSTESEQALTLLKKEPLIVEEVNEYGGVGTANNRVNRYAFEIQNEAYNENGYGGIDFYSSSTCGKVTTNSAGYNLSGCTTEYDRSDVKYVIDNWALDKLESNDLYTDEYGYKVRLIKLEELFDLGYENSLYCTGICNYTGSLENVPSWVYNSNYIYWTMTQWEDAGNAVWRVDKTGDLLNSGVRNSPSFLTVFDRYVVRPVITLKKKSVNNSTVEKIDSTSLKCD